MHRTIRALLPGMLSRAKRTGRTALDRQYRIGRLVDPRPAEPLRLWRQQGGGDRAHQSVAADFIRDGIRCNAVAPGTFRSPSWEERVEALAPTLGSKEAALEMFVNRQPMGRVAEAKEIAPIAVYLAADELAFTTGAVFSVDGGFAVGDRREHAGRAGGGRDPGRLRPDRILHADHHAGHR